MERAVCITRFYTCNNECLGIYGVYSDYEKAAADLIANERNLVFDEEYWVWRDQDPGYLYRIDEYTVH